MKNLMPLLQDREVLVLGLGASGLAMARWCALAGARVTVADTRQEPPQAATLKAEWPEVRVLQGDFDAALYEQGRWAMVCRSPGIAPTQMAGLVQAVQAVGVPVLGELDLFVLALDALAQDGDGQAPYRPKLLAITGTNGKTTVTSLTGLLLERAGWQVAVAGNIGPNLLDVLRERLTSNSLPQAWVLELSSFQLDGVENFEPTAATVLNITQDHLDWHGDMPAYVEAKGRIFGRQGVMVLNRDDPLVMAWKPQSVSVKEGGRQRLQPTRPCVTFGIELPQRPGDWGLENVNGMAWLVRAHPADETRGKGRGGADDEILTLQRLMPAEALRIRGRHNASNALAALALAIAAGAPLAPMLHGLREYRGEPHRVESVAVVDGVEYFDDSKGTNVGATLAAIQGLGSERRLVVILGGEGKGQDFTPLAQAVQRNVRAVVLIGRDGPLIGEALADTGVVLRQAGSMQEAVQEAAGLAVSGDAVLLSPACASFDMFRNYGHRGEVFVEAVQGLQADRGTAS